MKYRIEDKATGESLGHFTAENESGALDAMAKAAGFINYVNGLHFFPKHLIVIPIDPFVLLCDICGENEIAYDITVANRDGDVIDASFLCSECVEGQRIKKNGNFEYSVGGDARREKP